MEAGGNNRSVMPLDVLGRTRATLMHSASKSVRGGHCRSSAGQPARSETEMSRQTGKHASCWGSSFAIVGLERGIPSKCESSTRVDYVPALCTHRPSLLPIEWLSEVLGFSVGLFFPLWKGELQLEEKMIKLGHLEEVKVVTR